MQMISRRQALRQLLSGAGAAAVATTGLLIPEEPRRRIWQVGEKLESVTVGLDIESGGVAIYAQAEGRTHRWRPVYANGKVADYTRRWSMDYMQADPPPDPGPEIRRQMEEFMRRPIEGYDLEHFVHDEYIARPRLRDYQEKAVEEALEDMRLRGGQNLASLMEKVGDETTIRDLAEIAFNSGLELHFALASRG